MERSSEIVLTEYLQTKSNDLLTILHERMRRKLLSVAIRILGSPDDAEDVVQDVFCKLCELEPQPIRSAESFLFKMTQNLALNLKKHNGSGVRKGMASINAFERWEAKDKDDWIGHRRHVAIDAIVEPVAKDSGGEEVQWQELSREVRGAMNDLPENQREAVQLYYARGLTIAETAEVLGIGEQNANSLIHRGIKALRDSLVPKDKQVAPRPRIRPVQAIDPDSGAVVVQYASMKEAIEAGGGSGRHLRDALKKGARYHGYVWSYTIAV